MRCEMTLFCPAKEFYPIYQDIAQKSEKLRMQVKGGSMHPFIRSGDWVNLVPVNDPVAPIRIGEIILFRKDDNLYMHRVIRLAGEHVIPKGDMSFGADGEISKKDILARVVSVERGGRRIDLSSGRSLFINGMIAKVSPLMRYPVSALGAISKIIMAILSRIQARAVYRIIAKKIIRPNICIRSASPEDEEGMRDLYLMNGADIRRGIESAGKEGFWLVAEIDKKIAGGLTVTRHEKDPSVWVIFSLEVKPILRGLGIGRMMVLEALARARSSFAREIGLFVNKKARPAVALYTQIGFRSDTDIPSGFNISPDELYLSYKFKA